ncbi:MAG: UDP-N-acetylmuramate dehydrogenase [Thermosediminibacterales bacterium]|nr:UDP-N-acetylmuramate dehydrogenase [Thermosediminibacterales bacterium]MDK2836591.1 UDP-N-acetylmuramate dehydrogenase [Thermosediminibacterales bacterium]
MIINKHKLFREFAEKIDESRVLLDEPMKDHTSFRIGGPADILVIPKNLEELKHALNVCRRIELIPYVIGNGSNLLVLDKGIRGVVIKIASNFSSIKIFDDKIRAHAGVLLAAISKKAMEANLSGMEFAGGIPGSLGGAIYMNAGAYGGEMKDVVEEVKVMDYSGNIKVLSKKEMNFGYRHSRIQEEDFLIILEALLKLQKGDYNTIKQRMDELAQRRKLKQPLCLPSAGSTFKRPDGFYAGKLIEELGLKGYRVGDAQVSELHAGFIVNVGNATAKDVLELIKQIQQKAKERYNVDLEPEVKILGEY